MSTWPLSSVFFPFALLPWLPLPWFCQAFPVIAQGEVQLLDLSGWSRMPPWALLLLSSLQHALCPYQREGSITRPLSIYVPFPFMSTLHTSPTQSRALLPRQKKSSSHPVAAALGRNIINCFVEASFIPLRIPRAILGRQ